MASKPSAAGLQQQLIEEQQVRNELFAGSSPTASPSQGGAEPTIDQLVNTAVKTHKDTTATAQRALKVRSAGHQSSEQQHTQQPRGAGFDESLWSAGAWRG